MKLWSKKINITSMKPQFRQKWNGQLIPRHPKRYSSVNPNTYAEHFCMLSNAIGIK